MKIAIVHDWLVSFRGSERVLLELSRAFPDADIYSSVLDKSKLPEELAERDIRTTFLQRLPFARSHYQMYLPVMPLAYEKLDLSVYDLIISSSHCCAKGVIAHPGTKHICYCYTPMRYAWSGYQEYRDSLRPILRPAMRLVMSKLRRWDSQASSRVDHFIACSNDVKERIQRFYRRDATVVFPPVEPPRSLIPPVDQVNSEIQDAMRRLNGDSYYLCLGRVVGYKRVDLAVDACTRLGRWLLVAGTGPEIKTLRRRAGNRVIFIETFTDAEAAFLYHNSKALIFPGNEDFGITVVEAQSYGTPVIAYGEGGARDTVLDKETGLFFEVQTIDSLLRAIEDFEQMNFDSDAIVKHTKEFLPGNFRNRIEQEVIAHLH